ncbi:MAG: helicase C-terminal domain-containing protein [Terriglobia bacterium]
MRTIEQLISAPCLQFLKDTIVDAGGNEVFFLAKPDEQNVIKEIIPLARGNDAAVPALMQVAAHGDVILHNHPSGQLIPSPADLSIASIYGNQGVGFYIINNSVDQVYVVVEAFPHIRSHPLEPHSMVAWLSSTGPLAGKLKNFESRPEQQRMIEAVTQAFNHSQVALIEAGTGTGKSLSYLIPAVFWAVRNKQRVVISTNTIHLQEQLIHKDLPLLQEALNLSFRSELVKGRSNYVCLSKVEQLEKEGEYLIETEEQAELKALLSWAHKTTDGSRSDLPNLPKPAVWEKVACESDNCGRIRCPHYSPCFFFNARRQAASADLLIVNHHLLFSDLAIRGETGRYQDAAIMPAYAHIILDEAHNVEEVATEYFGSQISKAGLLRLLGRFYHRKDREKLRERGLFPFLLAKLKSAEKQIPVPLYLRLVERVQQQLLPQRETLTFAADQFFYEMASFFERTAPSSGSDRPEKKIRFTQDLRNQPQWNTLILPAVSQLMVEIKEFHRLLLLFETDLDQLVTEILEPLLSLQVELRALTDRVEAAALTLGQIFDTPDDALVRWVEIREGKSGKQITLKQAPVSVAERLHDNLFQRFSTVVLSSATLTTHGHFEYLKNRLGLQSLSRERMVELVLPSSFNFAEQVILGIPGDVPLPTDQAFARELGHLLKQSIRTSEGRALVLFTSYSLMHRLFQELQADLESSGLQALMQGQAPRHRLLEIFKRDTTSVLFATDSFWEGVDVAGESLENVILTKLPFSVPKEPVIEARVEALEKAGKNAFLEYTVPRAIIKFKQGAGRLIRSRQDFGSIMIFDRRIVTKSYGRAFLDSLPDCPRITGQREVVFAKVKEFFQQRRKQQGLSKPSSR